MKTLQCKMRTMTTIVVKQHRTAPKHTCIPSELLLSAAFMDLEKFCMYREET